MLGLYDSHGVLRYAGRDQADCLAYAELFGLDEAAYSLEPLAVRVMDLAASADSAAVPAF
ncbi:MAG: hypothetical protein AB1Z21_04310 [Synechococcaceae cyanobacterium]